MVIRNNSTYRIHTRIGIATVSHIIPIEDRTTHAVLRWECRLTLTDGDFNLFEQCHVVPDAPFKPLSQYTKLDLQSALEKLAQSPHVAQFLTRFESAYAQVPNSSFDVGQLVD